MNLLYKLSLLSALTWVLSLCAECALATSVAANQIPVQTHTAVKLNNTSPKPEYSYYVYLPKDYYTKAKHPILINFPGIEEWGPSDGSKLSLVLKNGPARLIKDNVWDKQEGFKNQPFIVITPQSWDPNGLFGPDNIKKFLEDITAAYKVDADRIYFTGLSGGAISSFKYFAKHSSSKVAAAVLIAGNGSMIPDNNEPCSKFENTAVWAFHGFDDPRIPRAGIIRTIKYINDHCRSGSEEKWKLTIYPGVGHDSWTKTYNLTGINSSTDPKYNPYDENMYTWLLRHSKGGTTTNQPPVARAGADVTIQLPTNQVQLSGSASSDPDGSIAAYAWSKTSGPSGATLSGQNTASLTASNLKQGTYLFQLQVTDNQGATATDQVQVTVTAAPASPTVWLEAECGAVGSNWQTINDAQASGGTYMVYPNGTGSNSQKDNPPTDAKEHIVFQVNLATAGSFNVFARVRALTNDDNSFWVKVNNGSWQAWMDGLNSSGFSWKQVFNQSYSLSAGSNTITFAVREDGTQLDKLLISLDSDIPTGTGPASSNCGGNNARTVDEGLKQERLLTEPVEEWPTQMLAYPNPADQQLTIELPGPTTANGVLLITDLAGKVIRRWEPPLTEGNYELQMDTHDIPAGLYLLRGATPALPPVKLFIEH